MRFWQVRAVPAWPDGTCAPPLVILIQISTKKRWIVGIDADRNASIHQLLNAVVLHIGEHLQCKVAEGTDCQKNVVSRQPIHQFRILNRTDTVINPAAASFIQRIPYAHRTIGLACVGSQVIAQFPGPPESFLMPVRRISGFGAVESHSHDVGILSPWL